MFVRACARARACVCVCVCVCVCFVCFCFCFLPYLFDAKLTHGEVPPDGDLMHKAGDRGTCIICTALATPSHHKNDSASKKESAASVKELVKFTAPSTRAPKSKQQN